VAAKEGKAMIPAGLAMTVLTQPLQTFLMGVVFLACARAAISAVAQGRPMRHLGPARDRVRIELHGHRGDSKNLRMLNDADAESLMKAMLLELRTAALARAGAGECVLSAGQVRVIVTPKDSAA
jgi:hypothetical protein